jgi:hypothetical protein
MFTKANSVLNEKIVVCIIDKRSLTRILIRMMRKSTLRLINYSEIVNVHVIIYRNGHSFCLFAPSGVRDAFVCEQRSVFLCCISGIDIRWTHARNPLRKESEISNNYRVFL